MEIQPLDLRREAKTGKDRGTVDVAGSQLMWLLKNRVFGRDFRWGRGYYFARARSFVGV